MPRRRLVLQSLLSSIGGVALPGLLHAAEPAKAAAHARHGVHGMVLFGGRQGLYASHMPLFKRPHDLQVLLRLQAAPVAVERDLRERLARRPALWSIEPEAFDLDRLQPGHADPLRRFAARVFQGHFERGGTLRRERVVFEVESVPLYERLDATPRRAAAQSFLLLARGRDAFLVKRLDQRPDVDLIARVPLLTPPPASVGPLPLISLPLAAADAGLRAPPADALLAALRTAGLRPRGKPLWLYEETSDLV